MTAEGGPETGETPRMLLIFEGLDADELIRPAQVAAVLTALDEIFLVTLLRDAPPPDHARREWALDYDSQAVQIGLEGLSLESPLHVVLALPWHAYTHEEVVRLVPFHLAEVDIELTLPPPLEPEREPPGPSE
jgi:hypothetical protein